MITIAETAQELKEKYKNQRLTPRNASRLYLINFVYWAYCTNEGRPSDFLDKRVYEEKTLKLLEEKGAIGLYCFYNGMCTWINTAMESAVLIRNSLGTFISNYYSIAYSVIMAEKSKKCLDYIINEPGIIKAIINDTGLKYLNAITVEAYLPANAPLTKKVNLRNNLRSSIDNFLRYLNVYNTLIAVIAEEVEVPEMTVFQVSMTGIDRSMRELNEIFEQTVSIIEENAKIPDNDGNTLSPSMLERTLKEFQPIDDKAPPIPSKNIDATKRILKETKTRGQIPFNGDDLFKTMAMNYWRR